MNTSDEDETMRLATAERDQLYSVIGRIVVNFQQVELWLSEALSSVLSLKSLEDRHTILSAMSFKQKVNLMAELYPRKNTHAYGVEMKLIKKALNTAEEFRNRIVHSIWAVEVPGKWVRVKGNIKGKNGFNKVTIAANIPHLEAAADALLIIREWELNKTESLEVAISKLNITNTDA